MDEAAKFSFFSSIAEYGRSILRLFGSVPFVLLVVSYGPGVATYGIAGTGTGIHYKNMGSEVAFSWKIASQENIA